ncbi:MAG: TIGR02266 family protein, partial [Myxococcales bacterium]|nr:TIGR02266 family protein [Myxococcales bacterium]
EYEVLNAFFSEYTKNIGHGGTFVRTDDPLEIGTEFVFSLVVPQLPAPLELRGRVHWRVTRESALPGQEPGMGIGFIYDSEVERARVEAIVERLMNESLGPVVSGKLLTKVHK